MKIRRPQNIVFFVLVVFACLSPVRVRAADFDAPLPPPDILKLSRVMLSHLEAGRTDAAQDALDTLVKTRLGSGIRNLTPIAAAFISVFNDGTVDVSPRQRRDLAQAAVELAPDYPRMYFLVARVRLDAGLNGIGPAFAAFFKGLTKIPAHPRAAAIYAANGAFYLQGVILILYIIGAFALLFRYFSLFRHDFGDIFPGTAGTHFTALDIRESRGGLRALFRMTTTTVLTFMVLIVLLSPLILGFGLIAAAALWMFISFPYAGRSERVFSILATLVIACLPVAGSIIALPDRLEESSGAMRWTCINEYCPADSLSVIQGDIVSLSGAGATPTSAIDARMAFAAGSRQWAGNSPDALHDLRTRLQADTDMMGSGEGRVRHGNLLVLESLSTCPNKHPDSELLRSAVTSYETAIVLTGPGEPAWRGLSVAHGLLGEPLKTDEYIQKILGSGSSRDLDFIVGIKTATTASDACLRFREIAAELRPPDSRDGLSIYLDGQSIVGAIRNTEPRIPLAGFLFGSITPAVMPFVLVGFIILGILLTLIIPRSRRAVRCQTCGHVTCPSCNRLASGFDHCPICLFDKVKPSFLDPEDVQIMLKPRGASSLRRPLIVLLSIAIPGSGQIVGGKAFRGMAMLMLLGLGLELVLFPEFPIIDSFAYTPPSANGLPILPPALLVIAWGWSVIDILLSRGK